MKLRLAHLIAILTLSVAVIAGCGSTAKPLTAQQILDKSSHSSLKDATFTMTMSLTGGPTGSLTMAGNGKQTVNPDQYEMTLTTTVFGQTITLDDITSGGFTYEKTTPGDATWTKKPASDDTSSGLFTGSGDVSNPTLVGTETLNGVKAYHIHGVPAKTGTPVAGDTSENSLDIWVRTDNFYPLKFAMHEKTTTDGSSSVIDGTITYTAWNTGVTITAPPADQVSGS